MKPVIALVGRPNVGKSTLFNRLTKTRDAIVADYAGLTRDRHYGNGRVGRREFIVVDTGGFEPDAGEGSIYREMARQTRQAVAEADVVVFVVDAREGLSAQDHDIANYLRRLGKTCILVANKAEGMTDSQRLAEFYELGLGDVHGISAAHGQGIHDLLELALDSIQVPEPGETDDASADDVIRLAVAGRPNVGKSTLINAWLGEERLVAFDLPGTTRDAIHVPFVRKGQKYELVDTAGLRRKGKVFEAIEKFSVVKTLQAIESANVVLLLLDATRWDIPVEFLADWLRGLQGDARRSAVARLQKMLPAIANFALGCALAALAYVQLGMWCFALPPLVAAYSGWWVRGIKP